MTGFTHLQQHSVLYSSGLQKDCTLTIALFFPRAEMAGERGPRQ